MGMYKEQWKVIKRVQRFTLVWFAAGMILPIAVALVVPDVASRQTWTVTGAIVVAYLGLWSAGCLYLRRLARSFKCPRCGARFDMDSPQPYQECGSCGLKRDSES
jgi:ribosomal protein S27AE